jgi:hypothetical protein
MNMRALPIACVVAVLAGAIPAGAQTPVPFPKPGQQPPPTNPKAPVAPPVTPPRPGQPAPAGQPTEATLGVPIYPSARFIASYDAGQGQRYYIFGTEADFPQIVTFYKTMLKQKGEIVFEEPPVHMFDIGRFKEETMAFPPSVTVKDYAWAGSQGYLNPKRGEKPERYRTIIQIVPAVPGVK